MHVVILGSAEPLVVDYRSAQLDIAVGVIQKEERLGKRSKQLQYPKKIPTFIRNLYSAKSIDNANTFRGAIYFDCFGMMLLYRLNKRAQIVWH